MCQENVKLPLSKQLDVTEISGGVGFEKDQNKEVGNDCRSGRRVVGEAKILRGP